jgi:hypothetical protein
MVDTRNNGWPSLHLIKKETRTKFRVEHRLRSRILRVISDFFKEPLKTPYIRRFYLVTIMEIMLVNQKMLKQFDCWDLFILQINDVCKSYKDLNKDYYLKYRHAFEPGYKTECQRAYIKHIFTHSILGPDIANIIAHKFT